MGNVKHDTLVILSPKNKVRMYKIYFITGESTELKVNKGIVNEAVAWYQGASYLYNAQKFKALETQDKDN